MFVRRALLPALASSFASVVSPAAEEPHLQPEGSPKPHVTSVEYKPGTGCPDETAFRRQVEAHLEGRPRAKSLSVLVEVHGLEGRATARVTFRSANGGAGAVRELPAASCEEAAAAAALVVALALDAETEQPKPESPRPADASEPPRAAPVEPAAQHDRESASPRVSDSVFFQLGAGAVAEHAIAPSPLFGVRGFVGLGESSPSWSLRAIFLAARSGVVESAAESAEFSLIAGQIEGCAFPIVSRERFALDPCVVVELGRIASRGLDSDGYVGSERSTFWAAAGPGFRARYFFNELSVEAIAGPWVPIAGTRSFVFDDPAGNRTFHEVPPVGWFGSAGLALRVR
jgi:hypothetical protein